MEDCRGKTVVNSWRDTFSQWANETRRVAVMFVNLGLEEHNLLAAGDVRQRDAMLQVTSFGKLTPRFATLHMPSRKRTALLRRTSSSSFAFL